MGRCKEMKTLREFLSILLDIYMYVIDSLWSAQCPALCSYQETKDLGMYMLFK
jgi:hypothetical protein